MKRFINTFFTESHAFTGLFFLALGVYAPSYKLFLAYVLAIAVYIFAKNIYLDRKYPRRTILRDVTDLEFRPWQVMFPQTKNGIMKEIQKWNVVQTGFTRRERKEIWGNSRRIAIESGRQKLAKL